MMAIPTICPDWEKPSSQWGSADLGRSPQLVSANLMPEERRLQMQNVFSQPGEQTSSANVEL